MITYATGTSPSPVAAGDFNGDGLIDLACTGGGIGGGSDTVSARRPVHRGSTHLQGSPVICNRLPSLFETKGGNLRSPDCEAPDCQPERQAQDVAERPPNDMAESGLSCRPPN